MKEKTYHRMTKKRSLRGFKLFKQKYLTKPRLYALLAKFHLVREVRQVLTQPYTNDTLNKVHTLTHKIKTDRGQFNLSYKTDCDVDKHKWYYESLFKKKKLFTIEEDKIYYHLSITVRSECEEFLVKINPFLETTVTRKTPAVQVIRPCVPCVPFWKSTEDSTTTEIITCNFLNARLGVDMFLCVEDEKDIDEGIKELVSKATARLHNYIEGNPEAINEKLTGIKFDGAFQTEDGQRLLPNNLCHKCGFPVFSTTTEGYYAQCVHCYEDLYPFEVDKVDPKYYEDVYEKCKYNLFEILTP